MIWILILSILSFECFSDDGFGFNSGWLFAPQCTKYPPTVIEECDGRNCYNIDVNLVSGVGALERVVIASTESGQTSYFDVYFTANGGDCLSPEIDFSFKLIDYDQENEYLEIYDGNTLLKKCQGGESDQCDKCSECLDGRHLRTNIIPDGQTYKITMKESYKVHARTCSEYYSTYALLTLICQNVLDGEKNSPFTNPNGIGPRIGPNKYPSSLFGEYKDTLNMILLFAITIILLYLVYATCRRKQQKGAYRKVVGFDTDDVESEAEKNALK